MSSIALKYSAFHVFSVHYIAILKVNYVIFRYDYRINRYTHFLMPMCEPISADKPEYTIPSRLIHRKVVRQQTSVSMSTICQISFKSSVENLFLDIRWLDPLQSLDLNIPVT